MRIRSHKLAIETGGYKVDIMVFPNVTIHAVIEVEYHFFFLCKHYEKI